MTRHLYALLVGINEYTYPLRPLYGCINDIKGIETYLRERTATEDFTLHLHVLKNEAAKRQTIIDGFREHLCQAGKDDVALFYFAGHGAREPAPPEFWPFEPDHRNETLVCWDSRTQGVHDLADKELAKLIAEVAQKGPHILVLLDCCHSGSGTREPLRQTEVRLAPEDPRQRPLESYLVSPEELQHLPVSRGPEETPSSLSILPEGRHILLAACRNSETAKEYDIEGATFGTFSYFLQTTLKAAAGSLSYRDVFKRTRARVMASIARQTPQLESSETADLGQPFLGGAIAARPPTFTISHDGEGWLLDAGAVHGIPTPMDQESTVLALFPLDASPEALHSLANAEGTAEILEVLPHASRVTLSGIQNPDLGTTFKAVIISLPLPPIGLRLEGDPQGLALMQTELSRSGPDGGPSLYIREVTTTPHLQVLAYAAKYSITRPTDTCPLVAEIQGYSAKTARQVVQRLEHIARWIKTAELSHPGSRLGGMGTTEGKGSVEMCIVRDGVEMEPGDLVLAYRYENGTSQPPIYAVRLKNHTHEALYCAVLGLWEDFAIDVPYFPAGGIWLGPGEDVTSQPMYASVPTAWWEAGVTQCRDVLKLIAASAEFDATLLVQPALDRPRLREARAIKRKSALNRLLNRVQMRGDSPHPEGEVWDDWCTDQLVMTVRRPLHAKAIPNAGDDELSLGAGVSLAPHPALVGKARLSTLPQANQDLGKLVLAPILREVVYAQEAFHQPLRFTPSLGSDPGLQVLALHDVRDHTVVTPENPLRLTLSHTYQGLQTAGLPTAEHILAYGYDGTSYLPLGYGRIADGPTEVTLTRLPAPVRQGRQDLAGTFYVFFHTFRDTALRTRGNAPTLAMAHSAESGQIRYDKDLDTIKAQVAEAQRLVLCISGWADDIDTMLKAIAERAPDALLLVFDCGCTSTPLEALAQSLGQRLAAVGLTAGHAKRVQVVAQALGGLVARWWVEREGGAQIVHHGVLLGTPNAGIPWATLQQWATVDLGVALNSLSETAWPARVLGGLSRAFGAALINGESIPLTHVQPGADFLKALAASADPHVPYTVIAGTASLIPATLEARPGESAGYFAKVWQRLFPQAAGEADVAGSPLEAGFFEGANDLAVSVASMTGLGQPAAPDRVPKPKTHEVDCDHMSYFSAPAALEVLAEALG